MKKDLLLPHAFQKIGWVILIPFAIMGVARWWIEPDELFRWFGYEPFNDPKYFTTNADHWINNILIIGAVIGAFLTTCSRERIEDEMTVQLRLRSLMQALWINYALVIVLTLLVYDIQYVVIITYDMVGFLVLFLAIFRWRLWRSGKEATDEE